LPSLLDLIADRGATASTTVEQLRERIAQLTDQLAAAETELAELAITRKTLTRPTGGDIQAPTPVDTPVDATIASPAYQTILAAFATTPGGMRAKDLCLALGLDIPPNTPRAPARNSNASSPAASSPNPSRACSPSPQPRPHSPASRTSIPRPNPQ
jgi:hypothetical protein